MKRITFSRLFCLAVACMPMGPAVAQTPAGKAQAATAARAGFDKPASAATLDSYRGGTQVVENNMRLLGNTAGNSAENVATGNNSIGTGAFANMNGFAIAIQNSGANVLIQNAVILHLQMD